MSADGRIVGVSGPMVTMRGIAGAAPHDMVEVGRAGLPGEVTAIHGDLVRAQVYESTGGLAPGDQARGMGAPLSAPLGPGLLGGIFDGLLRPLGDADTWLAPRRVGEPPRGEWPFTASVAPGADLAAGRAIGSLGVHDGVEHLVLVPPGVAGTLEWLHGDGVCGADEHVATVGGVRMHLTERWPLHTPRPFRRRLAEAVPLVTGQRAIDLLLPIAQGSTAAVVGGFGEGKTVLLQQIAKWCDADVIVYVGCGERGNELADVVDDLRGIQDPRTGRALMDRTVIIANTSNMPVMAREASIHAGLTVAEYHRDMGLNAVVIADSTSRWAEAQREFASRTGALPAEEGYPADLPSALAAFYERAGRVVTLGGTTASVTLIASVSPPGGDVTEPVTTHTQRFVRGFLALDRELAYARHYPAIGWRTSFSRDADDIARWYAEAGDPAWAGRRAAMQQILVEADRLRAVAELVGLAGLPPRNRMTLLAARLLREAVLQQNALSPTDGYCAPARGARLIDLVLEVHRLADALVEGGVAASMVEAVDFAPVTRARELAADGAVGDVLAAVRRELEGLA